MQPNKISIPLDQGPHETVIEWWYFNGHLHDPDGNAYAFMDCLFKADIEKVDLPYVRHVPIKKVFKDAKYFYFAHSLLSDIRAQKTYKDVQNISMVSNDSFGRERLFINYIDPIIVQGFTDNVIEETATGVFHIKTERFNLAFASKKPPLLEGGAGHITVCGRDSYYYSLTDLEASGHVTIDGKRIEVKGKAWMDHQWANVAYRQDIWTWFSFQLDDGTDMMCCEYDDGQKKDCIVDGLAPSGKDFHYTKLSLAPGSDIWKSPTTNAEYPLRWTISIPEYGAELQVRALVKDNELISLGVNYWEGPIEVSGKIGGKEVKGVGFMELVGYATDYNHLLAGGKEIAKRVVDFLKGNKGGTA